MKEKAKKQTQKGLAKRLVRLSRTPILASTVIGSHFVTFSPLLDSTISHCSWNCCYKCQIYWVKFTRPESSFETNHRERSDVGKKANLRLTARSINEKRPQAVIYHCRVAVLIYQPPLPVIHLENIHSRSYIKE